MKAASLVFYCLSTYVPRFFVRFAIFLPLFLLSSHIGEAASITILSPSKGEVWPVGSRQTIWWTSDGLTSSFVSVELSRDGGSVWEPIIDEQAVFQSKDEPLNWIVTGPPCRNGTEPIPCKIRVTGLSGVSSVSGISSFLMAEASIRPARKKDGTEVGPTSLEDRTPLILIYGWHGDQSTWDEEGEFLDFLSKPEHASFLQKIKPYLFFYDSHRHSFSDDPRLDDLGKSLSDQIQREFGNKQVLIVGHSAGGLIARSFLQEQPQGEQVLRLLTLGTPHHGTPVANVDVNPLDAEFVDDMKWDDYSGQFGFAGGVNGWLRCLNGISSSGCRHPENPPRQDIYGKLFAYGGDASFDPLELGLLFFSYAQSCRAADLSGQPCKTDGFVPLDSALFKGGGSFIEPAIGTRRTYLGCDHEDMASARCEFASEGARLFGDILLDLVTALPPLVSWLKQPTPNANSGQDFTVSWKIEGGTTFSPTDHTNVHWDTIQDLSPATCAGRLSCQTTSFQQAANGTFNATITAPTVTTDTTYYFAAHAEIDGFDVLSSVIQVTVSPAPSPTPSTGTVDVLATLDGAAWPGAVNYTLSGPTTISGSSVPATFPDKATGSYTMAFGSGGPSGATLFNITPSPTQALTSGGSATFTLNFTTLCKLSVGPLTLNFGDVPVGTSADLMFAVQNQANAPPVTVNVSTASPFSITSASSFTAGSGQGPLVGVRFSPTAPAPVTVPINVTAPNCNLVVNATGNGTSGPSPGGTGSIRVNIVPQAAASAGAQWRLTTDGVWRNSGTIASGLAFGTYTVEFKTIPGWITPQNEQLTISLVNPDVWIDSDSYVQQAQPVPFNAQVVSPSSGESIGGAYLLKASAQDGSGTIQRIEFYIDSDSSPVCVDNVPKASGPLFNCLWDSRAKPNGPHTVTVRAYNPSEFFASSSPVSFAINNTEAPILTSLDPSSVNSGGPGFILIVNGSNFTSSSVIRIDAQDAVTTFISPNQLQTFVPQSLIEFARIRPVRVWAPNPIGKLSNALPLTINYTTPRVSIVAVDPDAREADGQSGSFLLQRIGGDINVPLTVYYTIGGTATNGVDYTALSGSATFSDGNNLKSIMILPILDLDVEGDETVTVTLNPNPAYIIESPGNASLTIFDDDIPSIPKIGVTPSTMARGETVTVAWTGINNPDPTDWIGLYSTEMGVIGSIYVSCAATPDAAKSSGICAFALPQSPAEGTYQMRLFARDSPTLLAESNAFFVRSGPTLTTGASTVAAGGAIVAIWSGIPAPAPLDSIGLYREGAGDTEKLKSIYVSCSSTPRNSRANGACPFVLPAGLTPGKYRLQLFSNDGPVPMAVSNVFNVTPPLPGLFQGLGDLPGGIFGSKALGVSSDGLTVVGESNSASGVEAFRWTKQGGMTGLGILRAVGNWGSRALAVSADGSTIVGQNFEGFFSTPVIWISDAGIQGIPDIPVTEDCSKARGISADGLTVVGVVRSGCWWNPPSPYQGFKWTPTEGLVNLGSLWKESPFSTAHAVSADGSIIVGWSDAPDSDHGFIWTASGGMVSLGGNDSGALAVSADAGTVVGSFNPSKAQGFIWTQSGGMQALGLLPGTEDWNLATGVSGDGTTVIGRNEPPWTNSFEAIIWDASNGWRRLKDVLAELGLDLTGWKLQVPNGISADGRTIVGEGINPDGNPEAWVARLPVLTPIGNNVLAQPVDPTTNTFPVSLTFPAIHEPGITSLTINSSGLPPPSGFRLGNPATYYDITTTAAFSGPITTCINYSGIAFQDEFALKLFHFEGGSWVDRTISLDTVNDVICGSVASLSPFGVFEVDNHPPTANAGGPYTVNEGGSITLNGSGSDPDSGNTLTYNWDLDGDGVFETLGQNATFSAASINGPAARTVRLRVTDNHGAISNPSTATVAILNVAPKITSVTNTGPVNEGSPVTVAITAADPGVGDVLTSYFDFDNDGIFEVIQSSPSATITYTNNGSYIVRVQVRDQDGGVSDVAATTVVVNNVPPSITSVTNTSPVNEGSPVTVTIVASDPGINDILTYYFDFDNDGIFEVGGGSPSASHVYADNGLYTVRVQVKDNDGALSDIVTAIVQVNNVPPTINITGATTVKEGKSMTLTVSAPDAGKADIVNIKAIALPPGAIFTQNPGNPALGTLTWTPACNQAGSHSATFQATDDDGASSPETTISLGVTEACQPVVAVTDLNNHTVSFIDAETNQVVNPKLVGKKPVAGDFFDVSFEGFAPPTKLYVAERDTDNKGGKDDDDDSDKGKGVVQVLLGPSSPTPASAFDFTLGPAIQVGNRPEGLALTPDGSQVWVANRNDDSISIIDRATDKVITTISLKGFWSSLKARVRAKRRRLGNGRSPSPSPQMASTPMWLGETPTT